VDVFLSPSPVSFCRLGIVVPKHGRRIVDRNRLKRRLREIGRRDVLPELQAGGFQVDVLVRARSQAYGAGFEVLNREVREAVEGLCSDAS
jgi:ribonuclease P protein component